MPAASGNVGGPGASRLRQRVQDSGPAPEDPVRAVRHRALPARLDNPGTGVNSSSVQRAAPRARRNQYIYSDQPVLRRGAAAAAIFALGIMPYITASIILQLLTVVIPRLEALKKEGQAGQTKITQYTRYLTWAGDPAVDRVRRAGPAPAGCSRGCTGRCSSTTRSHPAHHGPHDDRRHRRHHVARRADHRPWRRQRHVDPDLHPDRSPPSRPHCGASSRPTGWQRLLPGLAVGLVVMAAVIFIEQAQRRIPVQYAKRMVGRRMFGGRRRTSRSRSTRPASSR